EHGVTTLLTGPRARLRPVIARLGGGTELRVVPAEDVVGMGEGALAGFRRPRSSIAVACQLVRRGQANAVVSAGPTGGIVTTARLRLRAVAGGGPAAPGAGCGRWPAGYGRPWPPCCPPGLARPSSSTWVPPPTRSRRCSSSSPSSA